MKLVIISILFAFLLTNNSFTQSSYRIKKLGEKGEFIIPPETKLGIKKNGEKKFNYHQYFYVGFFGLNKSYYDCIEELNYPVTWSGNKNYFKETFSIENIPHQFKKLIKKSKKDFQNDFKFNKLENTNLYKSATLDDDSSILFIQFDYNSILSGDSIIISIKEKIDSLQKRKEKEISQNKNKLDSLRRILYKETLNYQTKLQNKFFALAKDLLIEISLKEKNGSNQNNWPTSISQNIVEKIFEFIPVPNQASLARYGWNVTGEQSFLLLNPNISLSADLNQFNYTEDPNTKEPWYYGYLGELKIDFYRNNNGEIMQIPFIKFHTQAMPPNGYNPADINDNKSLLISTKGDIQLSGNSNESKFIALYQNYMKRSSSYSNKGINNNALTKDDDIFIGNSYLLFTDNLSTLLNNPNHTSLIKGTIGVSGNLQDLFHRILIQPLIHIYVNDFPICIQLGTDISKIKQQLSLPNTISLKRKFGSGIAKTKHFDNNLILLPGDKISY